MTGPAPLSLDRKTIRRLAIVKQHLSGKPPKKPGAAAIMGLFKDLRYVQLDPTAVVAPSHQLVLWSRLGSFRTSDLDGLMWHDKRLFEGWAHAASIVLTEDYPLYSRMMKGYAKGGLESEKKYRDWVEANSSIRDGILRQLKKGGPLLTSEFEDTSRIEWESRWNPARKVPLILEFLFRQGRIMVAGRRGRQKLWDFPERFLPGWTPRDNLSAGEVETRGAVLSLRALGVATPRQMAWHFLTRSYSDINGAVDRLVTESDLLPVTLTDGPKTRDRWFIHAGDADLAQRVKRGDFEPRTTILSPFDNLIIDRDRTHQLFDFYYRIEIYTPKHKRKYGFFVLPILDGDRLVGRIDPVMDRERQRLNIHSVHAEDGVSKGKGLGRRVSGAIEDLADFLGAKEVVYTGKVPDAWEGQLR